MYKGTNLKEIQQKYQERMTDLFNEKIFLFFFCPIFLYSSSVLFITRESVNFPFILCPSLPSNTQFIIPGSSWKIISFARFGLILLLGIWTLKGAIKNLL